MAYTDRVKQILSWYPSDNPGTLTNLARLLNTGTLAGTGSGSMSARLRVGLTLSWSSWPASTPVRSR